MEITLSPRRLAGIFAALAICLIIAHVLIQSVRFYTGDDSLYGFVALFSLGSDRSLPGYYSSFAILFCALLLALIGVARWHDGKAYAAHWLALAGIFVFLSVDEMLEMHEKLNEPIRSALDVGGAFYYAWVIPYGVGLLILAAVYFRFLLQLPARTALLFVAAGATFVSGAAGIEMVSGWYSQIHGSRNVGYVALQSVEEILEMVGILIFIFALAEYIDQRLGMLRIGISSGAGAAGSGL